MSMKISCYPLSSLNCSVRNRLNNLRQTFHSLVFLVGTKDRKSCRWLLGTYATERSSKNVIVMVPSNTGLSTINYRLRFENYSPIAIDTLLFMLEIEQESSLVKHDLYMLHGFDGLIIMSFIRLKFEKLLSSSCYWNKN